jgi:hypothetical protein
MPEFKLVKGRAAEKTVISIRIEAYKLAELDDIAAKADISRNELIVQCVDFALANIEKSSLAK